LLCLGLRIKSEFKNRTFTIAVKKNNFTYKIVESNKKIISFGGILKKRNTKGISGIYIFPDEIMANPRKVYELLKLYKLPVILLERIRSPDPGELPAYYSDLSLLKGHLIPDDEAVKLSERKKLLRYRRAIIERGVKIILLPRNNEYIKTKLAPICKGYKISNSLNTENWFSSRFLKKLLFLLLLFDIIFLLNFIIGKRKFIYPFIGTIFLYIVSSIANFEHFYINLVATIIIIIYFFVIGYLILEPGTQSSRKPRCNSFYIVALSSLLLGILIYFIHSSLVFQFYIYRFRGIKIVLIAPLIAIFIQTFIYIASEKINIKKMNGLIVFLFIFNLIFILLKSTNWRIIHWNVEENIREFFEINLFVRPRFKEFLFGHPILLYGIYLLKKGNRRAVILIPFGMVGQISIINTYLHFSHPIYISLLTTIWGVIFGSIIGIIIIGIDKLVSKG
jgi:hypothetical protein